MRCHSGRQVSATPRQRHHYQPPGYRQGAGPISDIQSVRQPGVALSSGPMALAGMAASECGMVYVLSTLFSNEIGETPRRTWYGTTSDRTPPPATQGPHDTSKARRGAHRSPRNARVYLQYMYHSRHAIEMRLSPSGKVMSHRSGLHRPMCRHAVETNHARGRARATTHHVMGCAPAPNHNQRKTPRACRQCRTPVLACPSPAT